MAARCPNTDELTATNSEMTIMGRRRRVMKNAVEGIANPKLILPFSVLLLGGSVLPVVTLVWSIIDLQPLAIVLSVIGLTLGHLPRAVAAVRFRQPILGVLCHSLATVIFVSLQWIALLYHLLGRQIAWRGRTESRETS